MNDIYLTPKDIILATSVPEETGKYKPISHKQLIDLTLSGLEKAGFQVAEESYRQYKEGQVATGTYSINSIQDDEMMLQLGWGNSYNKTKPVIFTISTKIKVCSNGMYASYGLGRFKKKHVGEIQTLTPQVISDYIKGSGDVFKKMQDEREIMKSVEITKRVQAELIGRAFIEHGFIKSTQLNIINDEINNPTHDYGNPNSLWSLFNYTTFAMRNVHPSLHIGSHIAAHEFFTEAAKIAHSNSVYIPEVTNQLELELV